MDIVEYTEKVLDVKLSDWQKEHLRTLNEKRLDEGLYIVMRKRNGVYIYQDSLTKVGDSK